MGRGMLLLGAAGETGRRLLPLLKRPGQEIGLAGRRRDALEAMAEDASAHVHVCDIADASELEKNGCGIPLSHRCLASFAALQDTPPDACWSTRCTESRIRSTALSRAMHRR